MSEAWIDELAFRPSVATIGKFDAVHIGHRRIIEQLLSIADLEGLESVVVTFDRHPLVTLRPELAPTPLLSAAQKHEAIVQLGVDRIVEIPFDEHTASMPAETFVERILIKGIGARTILVGRDFRFGHRGAGDVALLAEVAGRHGVQVVVQDDVCARDGVRVSSTRIREALASGDIASATAMLGRPPQLRGTVVHGCSRGRELGFPTANLDPSPEGFIPADGVYAAWATVDAGTFPAAVSIGDNPTFDGEQKTVEAYLLDIDMDLYGQQLTLDLVAYLRPMLRFDGLEALIERMHEDVEETRELLSER